MPSVSTPAPPKVYFSLGASFSWGMCPVALLNLKGRTSVRVSMPSRTTIAFNVQESFSVRISIGSVYRGAVCRWFGSIEGIVDGCIALCTECRFYTAFGFIYRVFAFNFEYMFGIVESHYIVDGKDMAYIIEEPVITFVFDLIPLYFAQCC